MGLDRYWRTDRWHSHTVVFKLGDDDHTEVIDGPPAPYCFLCRSTAETRPTVVFVSAEGAASPLHLAWWERLHRWIVFHQLMGAPAK